MLLRVGVKAGGCSGMSYTMDFESEAKIGPDDTVTEYDGFKLVSDAMSLLYLFGRSPSVLQSDIVPLSGDGLGSFYWKQPM